MGKNDFKLSSNFKVPQSKAPNMKSGGNQFENKLMALMALQARGQAGQQQTGPGEVITGRRDPFSGTVAQTQEGQDFSVSESLRKKASEDALKLQQALPILDDLEKSYEDAYKTYSGATGGIQGGIGAGKEWLQGVILRQNPALRNFIDKVGQYEAPLVKLTGDVGNFSASERESASKGVPRVTPNSDFNRLFLPDDIEFGRSKIASLKNLYGSKYAEAKQVADTGQLSPGYQEWAGHLNNAMSTSPSSPVPGMPGNKPQQNNMNVDQERQMALDAIKRGAPEDKVRDRFRANTGQDL